MTGTRDGNEQGAARDDLVEPEGVNAGSSLAERDRRPSGDVDVEPAAPLPADRGTDGEMIGAAGQRDGVPGQQFEVGEG